MTIEEAFSLLDEMDHSTQNSIRDCFLLVNFLIKDFDNTEKLPTNWKYSESLYMAMLLGMYNTASKKCQHSGVC